MKHKSISFYWIQREYEKTDYLKNILEEIAVEDVNRLFDINIFRYKFSEEFTNHLYQFSKIHQYDHRKDFKAAWDIWLEENAVIVSEEVYKLTNLGYDGNILEKMFIRLSYESNTKNNFILLESKVIAIIC